MENTLHVYAQSVEEAITAAVEHNVQRINQQLNEFGYCQLEYVRPLGEEVKRRIKRQYEQLHWVVEFKSTYHTAELLTIRPRTCDLKRVEWTRLSRPSFGNSEIYVRFECDTACAPYKDLARVVDECMDKSLNVLKDVEQSLLPQDMPEPPMGGKCAN